MTLVFLTCILSHYLPHCSTYLLIPYPVYIEINDKLIFWVDEDSELADPTKSVDLVFIKIGYLFRWSWTC